MNLKQKRSNFARWWLFPSWMNNMRLMKTKEMKLLEASEFLFFSTWNFIIPNNFYCTESNWRSKFIHVSITLKDHHIGERNNQIRRNNYGYMTMRLGNQCSNAVGETAKRENSQRGPIFFILYWGQKNRLSNIILKKVSISNFSHPSVIQIKGLEHCILWLCKFNQLYMEDEKCTLDDTMLSFLWHHKLIIWVCVCRYTDITISC